MFADISSVSVMLFSNEKQIGSGCLLWSEDGSTLYCITAAHCLMEDDNISLRGDISIHNNALSINDPILVIQDSDNDIAIFIIHNAYDLSDIPSIPTYDYQIMDNTIITLSGFPFSCNKQRISVEGHILNNEDNRIEFTVESLDAFTEDRFDQVNGISGCGCFIQSGAVYKFVGIETGALTKDVPFKNLYCTKYSAINKLINEKGLSPLPNSTPDYITNGKFCVQTALDFLKDRFDNAWYETDIYRVISEKIIAFLEHSSPDDSTLFIGGLSGSGKTRSVLETIKGIKHFLYYECYQDFEDVINSIKKSKEKFYIIVDEATLENFQDISLSFKNKGDNYKIIIIGCTPKNPDYGYNETKTLFLDALTEQDTIAVLKTNYPQFDDEMCQAIFELSSNDLRLALLIAKIYTRFSNDKVCSIPSKFIRDEFTSAEKILKKMLALNIVEKPKHIDLETCFVHLSLFIDIGFKNQYEAELSNLAEYFKYPIEYYKRAIDYFDSIQLGIKKGDYFEESPRALAKAAFEQQGYGLVEYNLSEFMSTLQSQMLRERFVKRAFECGKKEVEEQVSSWFQDKYTPMNTKDKDFCERELMLLTEYYPEVGLDIIKNYVFCIADSGSLTSIPNLLRRHIVWTCEHLANFSQYFYECEMILFRLAQHETEKHISNNSQGVWCGFFSVFLSNTEESFLNRFRLLLQRACNATGADSSLFERAFEIVFNNVSSVILPPRVIGNKITPKGWEPQSYFELLDIKKHILEALVEIKGELCNDIYNSICTALINALDSFVTVGLFIEYQQAVNSLLNNQDQKNSLIIHLENEIRTAKRRNPENNRLITLMTNWIENLQIKDIHGRLEAFLTRDIYSYGYSDEDHEHKEMLISKLAADIMADQDNKNIICSILHDNKYDEEALLELSEKLAIIDEENILFEIILSFPTGTRYNPFVRGYYCGLYQKNNNILPDYALHLLDKIKNEDADFVLWASASFDVSEAGSVRITELIPKANNIRALINLGTEAWRSILPVSNKKIIIDMLFDSDNNQKSSIIFLLFDYWLKYEYSDSILFGSFFEMLTKCIDRNIPFNDYIIEGILERMPDEYQDRAIAIFVSLFDFRDSYGRFNHSIIDYIKSIKNELNESCIFNTLADRLLEIKHQSLFKAHTGIFDDYSLQVAIDWINQDKENRAVVLAYHLSMPTLDKPDFTELTTYLLTEYEHLDKVYHRFLLGNSNLKVIIPENIFKHRDAWVALTERYKTSEHIRIRQWAEDKRREIDSICDQYLRSEETYKRST